MGNKSFVSVEKQTNTKHFDMELFNVELKTNWGHLDIGNLFSELKGTKSVSKLYN